MDAIGRAILTYAAVPKSCPQSPSDQNEIPIYGLQPSPHAPIKPQSEVTIQNITEPGISGEIATLTNWDITTFDQATSPISVDITAVQGQGSLQAVATDTAANAIEGDNGLLE